MVTQDLQTGSSKKTSYFNELTVNLNDEAFFSSAIHERTRENPNRKVSIPCQQSNGSLDEYASKLTNEMLPALKR